MKFLQKNIKQLVITIFSLLFTAYCLGVIYANINFQTKLNNLEERQHEISRMLDAMEESLSK